jgi:peptidoglycan hydrolase-like protein with peptidoglycan-binding domain
VLAVCLSLALTLGQPSPTLAFAQAAAHPAATIQAAAQPAATLQAVTIQAAAQPAATLQAAASSPQSLRQGDAGPDVVWLQARLAALGLFRGRATGAFGPRTADAVRDYQARNKIATSGVVGPQTAASLLSERWRHTIRSGQTMGSIAAAHGLGLAQLRAANPTVTNPNRVFAGQVIDIPGTPRLVALARVASGASLAAASPAPSAPAPAASPPASPAPKPAQEPPEPAIPATATVSPKPRQPAEVVLRVPVTVFLTFDGALVPGPAARIMDALSRRSLPAAVFVTGKDALAWPEVVAEAVRSGLTVESAGWADANSPALTATQLSAELDKAAQAIAELAGRKPRWLRPAVDPGDRDYRAAAGAAGQALLWWHNIGALPDGPSSIGRLDRYLYSGAVIRLPISETTATFLETWLDHCRSLGVRFAPLAELNGAPRGF